MSDESDAGTSAIPFEAYKLAVEMADRVSARRSTANTFFISLQSALIAVLAFVNVGDRAHWVVIGVCVAGMVVASAWFLQLLNYRRLNRAKFAVIEDMEKHFPASAAIYGPEWARLRSDDGQAASSKWRKYVSLSKGEQVIAIVFGVLNAYLLVASLV